MVVGCYLQHQSVTLVSLEGELVFRRRDSDFNVEELVLCCWGASLLQEGRVLYISFSLLVNGCEWASLLALLLVLDGFLENLFAAEPLLLNDLFSIDLERRLTLTLLLGFTILCKCLSHFIFG